MFRPFLILSLVFVLVAAGCGKPSGDTSDAAAPASTNKQMFEVKGVVAVVKPEEKKVEIKHEAIPGYMGAMQMEFDVRDSNELAGIEPGDPVSFRLFVTDTDGWIDRIRKTGAKTNTPPTTGSFRAVRDVEPLNVGDVLPEYHFTNQLGQAFSTGQFKGQALAINFIFTRCPFPLYCPLTAKNFSEVQQRLLANGPTNWHLLTISFDPEFDTPAVLKDYANRYNANPGRWTFATGTLLDITAISDQVTLAFWRDQPGGLPTHNLRTVVINAAGRVQKIITGNEWTVDELVAEMVKAAGVK